MCVDHDSALDAAVAAIDGLVDTTQWDDVCVLHVVPKSPLFLVGKEQDSREHIEALVSGVAERLSHLPSAIETLVTTGDVAETIVHTAEANDIDLIVMGARDESRDFPVGSVSQKVVSLANADVLVARACEAAAADLASGFRALITVDGSRASEAAITSFASKIRAECADIRCIHVIESLPMLWAVGSRNETVSESLVRHAEEILAHAASVLAAHGLEAKSEWHHGTPATRILEVARRSRCGLIVVGAHGHTRLARLLLAPMTQRILRRAPCSVLCARAWAPEWAALASESSSESPAPQIGLA